MTPRTPPGESRFDPIVLERGVTHDAGFAQWANRVWEWRNDPQTSLPDFRKDLLIEMYDEAGRKVIAYTVYRCWPSSFEALPELDGSGNAIAIQSLKLENEGWERDTRVAGPAEPGFGIAPSS